MMRGSSTALAGLVILSSVSCSLGFLPTGVLRGNAANMVSASQRTRSPPPNMLALNIGTRAAHRRNSLCAPLNAETMRKKPESGKGWNEYVREGIEQPMTSKRQPEGPLEDDPSLPMIEDIVRSCDERKADFIWAARVAHLTYTTSFFVNVQGSSRPMLQAIAGNVEEMMMEKHQREIKWQVRYLFGSSSSSKEKKIGTIHAP
jgi:hypothetical protein